MTYQSKFKAWEEGRCVKFSHFVRHAITQRYHRSNMCCIETHSVVTYVSADFQDFSIPWALYDSCIFCSELYLYIYHIIKPYHKFLLKFIEEPIYCIISYLLCQIYYVENCSNSPKTDILLSAEIFSQDISTHYLTTDVYWSI